MMVPGLVVIDPDTGVETYTPPSGANLARELYQARAALLHLVDPNNPPSATTTAPIAAGTTTLQVDQTLGLQAGKRVAFSYGASAMWAGVTYQSVIVALTLTTITVADPLPVGVPAGLRLGFAGSSSEWKDQALPVLVKQKQSLADSANVDASVFVAHLIANAQIDSTVSAGGLQVTPTPNNPGTVTAPPLTPQHVFGVIK